MPASSNANEDNDYPLEKVPSHKAPAPDPRSTGNATYLVPKQAAKFCASSQAMGSITKVSSGRSSPCPVTCKPLSFEHTSDRSQPSEDTDTTNTIPISGVTTLEQASLAVSDIQVYPIMTGLSILITELKSRKRPEFTQKILGEGGRLVRMLKTGDDSWLLIGCTVGKSVSCDIRETCSTQAIMQGHESTEVDQEQFDPCKSHYNVSKQPISEQHGVLSQKSFALQGFTEDLSEDELSREEMPDRMMLRNEALEKDYRPTKRIQSLMDESILQQVAEGNDLQDLCEILDQPLDWIQARLSQLQTERRSNNSSKNSENKNSSGSKLGRVRGEPPGITHPYRERIGKKRSCRICRKSGHNSATCLSKI